MHNMIDMDYISGIGPMGQDSNRKEIIYVGKLAKNKGTKLFSDACCRLTDGERSQIKLTIIGEGPLHDELEKQLNENNIEFEFKGYLHNSEIISLLKSSYLFISTSLLNDTLSRSILEASACGTCVIATDVGGSSDIVKNHKTGLLVKPDVETLKNAISVLLASKSKRNDFAKQARIEIPKIFDKTVLVPKYESIYYALVDKN